MKGITMSVFRPNMRSKEPSKVHYSQYIKTENKPDEAGVKPIKPVETEQCETK